MRILKFTWLSAILFSLLFTACQREAPVPDDSLQYLPASTAMVAAVGSPHLFPDARHFASWLGLTPREHSSGNRRFLGKISKQGDSYLRMLLTHGARAVLNRAKQLRRAGHTLNRLQAWACKLEARVGHNKATCALANKLARICWATWKHQRDFDPNFAPA